MNDRPLGLISVDELVRVLPDLIADALRQRDTRPLPPGLATLTKATGVVTAAGTTTAEVQLDEDEPGVLSQVQLASAVAAGDRVVVLLSPGGSAIAIGSGSAQTAVPLLNGPGDPNGVITAPEGWLYEQNDAPDLWQNTDGATAWQLVGSGGGGVPTDWVEWTAALDTGLVDGANHHVEWEDTVTNATHGTAVTLNGSGDAEVAEDGWYTLDYYVLVEGETTGAVWGDARLRTDITRGFTAGGDHQEDVVSLIEFLPNTGGFAKANMPFSWTGYLVAGDTVVVHARMATSSVGSDTFEIGDGQFRMEKLPM